MHLIDMETPPPSSEDVDTYDDRLNVTDASPEPVSSMSLVDMETPPPSDDENIELVGTFDREHPLDETKDRSDLSTLCC